MNELMQAVNHFAKTGDFIETKDFFADEVRNKMKSSKKEKWKLFSDEGLENLTREQLQEIEDDLDGIRNIPVYKLNQILCLTKTSE